MSSPVASLAGWLDRRIGRRAQPPSLWPTGFGALLSHAAIVAFLVLLVTGVLLAFAFRPTVHPVLYTGGSELYGCGSSRGTSCWRRDDVLGVA